MKIIMDTMVLSEQYLLLRNNITLNKSKTWSLKMSFETYISESKLGVTAEQKAAVKALSKELVEQGQRLKSKLKVLPVDIDTKYMVVKVGFETFAIKGIPSLRVHAKGGRYGETEKGLDVSQSTADFTRETLKQYSDALKELYDNYDLIEEVLNNVEAIHRKYRDALN